MAMMQQAEVGRFDEKRQAIFEHMQAEHLKLAGQYIQVLSFFFHCYLEVCVLVQEYLENVLQERGGCLNTSNEVAASAFWGKQSKYSVTSICGDIV